MAAPSDLRNLGIEYLAPFGERGGRARSHAVHYTMDSGRSTLCGQALSRSVSWHIRTYSNPDYTPERLCPKCQAQAINEMEKAWEKEKERRQLAKLRVINTQTLITALRRRGVPIPELESTTLAREPIPSTDDREIDLTDRVSLSALVSQLRATQTSFQELQKGLADWLAHTNATIDELIETLESYAQDSD
jgi:hypothetical protein